MKRSEAWIAGYKEGFNTYGLAMVCEIIVPKDLQKPQGDFISGFLVGSRDAADNEIINDLKLD